jgi:hypothetical protein
MNLYQRKRAWPAGVVFMVAGIAAGAVWAQEPVSDDRQLLTTVSDHWRNHLLHDMREGLFVQVQEILEASGEGDMDKVARLATARGKAHFKKMDPKMMAELPKAMKGMGKAMHLAFDDVATAARSGGGAAAVSGAVSDLMTTCTACHSTFKLNK